MAPREEGGGGLLLPTEGVEAGASEAAEAGALGSRSLSSLCWSWGRGWRGSLVGGLRLSGTEETDTVKGRRDVVWKGMPSRRWSRRIKSRTSLKGNVWVP